MDPIHEHVHTKGDRPGALPIRPHLEGGASIAGRLPQEGEPVHSRVLSGPTESGMSTVLVTGGSGFIGSHTILQLLAAGHDVRTTIRSPAREAGVRAMLR